jgi:uncharacterized damage-inducible protein DinB
MLPNSTLRGWHLDQMHKSIQIIHSLLETTPPGDLTTFRDNGSGWTALEVLCHLRDFEAIYMERAHLTIAQSEPALPNADPDALAAERRYNEQNVAEVYADWSQIRDEFMTYLENLDEAAWGRIGIHNRRGPMTLQDQLALTAWHDVNHLEQITRILAEKKQ